MPEPRPVRLAPLPAEQWDERAHELASRHSVAQSTWDDLGRNLTDQQRMDLVFTIGGYLLLAMAVNTFGVQDEQQ